jgi:hypothetical protein
MDQRFSLLMDTADEKHGPFLFVIRRHIDAGSIQKHLGGVYKSLMYGRGFEKDFQTLREKDSESEAAKDFKGEPFILKRVSKSGDERNPPHVEPQNAALLQHVKLRL